MRVSLGLMFFFLWLVIGIFDRCGGDAFIYEKHGFFYNAIIWIVFFILPFVFFLSITEKIPLLKEIEERIEEFFKGASNWDYLIGFAVFVIIDMIFLWIMSLLNRGFAKSFLGDIGQFGLLIILPTYIIYRLALLVSSPISDTKQHWGSSSNNSWGSSNSSESWKDRFPRQENQAQNLDNEVEGKNPFDIQVPIVEPKIYKFKYDDE